MRIVVESVEQIGRVIGRGRLTDRGKSRVVELRFFGGLTVEEIATVLEVAPITVKRDWSLAKAWLYRELQGEAV